MKLMDGFVIDKIEFLEFYCFILDRRSVLFLI